MLQNRVKTPTIVAIMGFTGPRLMRCLISLITLFKKLTPWNRQTCVTLTVCTGVKTLVHCDSLPVSSSNNLKISNQSHKLSVLPMKTVSASNHQSHHQWPPPSSPPIGLIVNSEKTLKGWRCGVRDLNQTTDKNGGCPVTIHNDGLVIYIYTYTPVQWRSPVWRWSSSCSVSWAWWQSAGITQKL